MPIPKLGIRYITTGLHILSQPAGTHLQGFSSEVRSLWRAVVDITVVAETQQHGVYHHLEGGTQNSRNELTHI